MNDLTIIVLFGMFLVTLVVLAMFTRPETAKSAFEVLKEIVSNISKVF